MRAILKTYSTSEVARLIGIHPNTVRLYEEWGMITPPERKANGYRVFTELHLYQFKIARTALRIDVLQNGLRKKAIDIINTTAKCDFDKALTLTREYIAMTETELTNAAEAVEIVGEICGKKPSQNDVQLKRKDVSALLGVSMDSLRNWEMNGLVKIKRKANGYRVYTEDDIRRFKIIRTLKCANYSLSAILRMLNALDENQTVDINRVLNSPEPTEDIITVYDRLAVSLNQAKLNAEAIEGLLLEIKEISKK